MTTVTEGLPGRSSEIKPFIAVLVPILSVKGVAGDASDPSLAVKKHVGGDAHGRDRGNGVRPHCIAVRSLMARPAYVSDFVAQRRRAAGKGKARVTFYARRLQQAAMRVVLSARGERGEHDGEYDGG